jgi:hypothetical protein
MKSDEGMKCKRRQKRRAGRKTGEEAKASNSLLFFYYFSSFCQGSVESDSRLKSRSFAFVFLQKVGLFRCQKSSL